MESVYSYETFMTMSKQLDRKIYVLPKDTIKTMYQIKKKLNIKELNHLKYMDLFDKPKVKQEGYILNDVYKCLNKITEKTYDKLSEDTLAILDVIVEEDSEANAKICQKFFDIISNSSLCCGLYAKLYHKICEKHEVFKTIFREHIHHYLEEFKEIKYVSPGEDYDAYCEYVKQIDKMKHFTLFLLETLKYCICDLDDIIDILLYFQERCIQTIEDESYILENEQVIDTMYLIIKETIDFMVFHDKWETIKRNHTYLYDLKSKGKNNKMKFKMMDIQDCISKNDD